MIDIKKTLEEFNLTEEKYEQLLDDCSKKVDKTIDLDWAEICEKYGIEWNSDSLRKSAQPPLLGGVFVKEYLEQKYAKSDSLNEEQYLRSLEEKKREILKETVKLRDERTNYNKLIRQEARKESYADMVKRIIGENVEPANFNVHYQLMDGNCDLLCHLTDIHTGIEINNYFNTFNQNVLKERLEQYISDILDIRGLHQAENCYLVIGEILSGIIHSNLRLQNNMDLIEQFKYISELISAMLARLACNFKHVHVYINPGNHSRISPNKEDSLDGENMDYLLPFYLKARMQNVLNVYIHDNEIDPEVAMFNIRGNYVISSHGHKDNPSTVVQNFTLMYNRKPDIVLLGHRHTNGMTTVYDTKVIQSGCVSGTDAYANSIRKVNKPEQTISVVNDKGLLCVYDIKLN